MEDKMTVEELNQFNVQDNVSEELWEEILKNVKQ
jgi:hypothetical protein